MSNFLIVQDGHRIVGGANDKYRAIEIARDIRDKENITTAVYMRKQTHIAMPQNHGKAWTREDDTQLLIQFMSGKGSPAVLADKFMRTSYAIQCRLEHLGLGWTDKHEYYRGWN